MNQQTQVTSNPSRAQARVSATPATSPGIVPAVDIIEDANGILLKADLPGVARERLDVRVESGHLLIRGEIAVDLPGDLNVMYAEVRGAHYERSFALSSELDPAKVEASLKDGVLTVRIARTEAARPRRIEVKAS